MRRVKLGNQVDRSTKGLSAEWAMLRQLTKCKEYEQRIDKLNDTDPLRSSG